MTVQCSLPRALPSDFCLLSGAQIAGLGGPHAEGIFVRHLHIRQETNNIVVTWNAAPALHLQRTSQLSQLVWMTAPGTFGTNIFIEPAANMPARLYRLFWQQ